ncbi:MAG: FHA domain-containing protein [Gammaproteobacteria bacterium]|nr:FHA domain-containing protein [Gammaproteobacteria bacterium]
MAELQLLVDGVVVSNFPLDKTSILIGRAPHCDIVIDEDAVSGEHARIELVPNDLMNGLIDVFIEDLGSTNGTFVNDDSIQRQQLQNQDYVRIAWTNFKLVTDFNPKLAKTSVIVE